jgi:hypothetical protein
MKIFASAAAEIPDEHPGELPPNSRYGDDSGKYAAGFPFANPLSTPLFNGVLHRITVALNDRLHCNAASVPDLNLKRPCRYNSKAEIENPEYEDSVNYILNEYVKNFPAARINPKLPKTEGVEDFFREPRDKTCLPRAEAIRAKGVFLSTSLIPRMITDYKTWDDLPPVNGEGVTAANLNAHLFAISPGAGTERKYAKLIIPAGDEHLLRCFEIRNTRGGVGYNRQLIVCIQFSEEYTFFGKPVQIDRVYPCPGRTFIAVKEKKLLAAIGLPGVSDASAESFSVDRAIGALRSRLRGLREGGGEAR